MAEHDDRKLDGINRRDFLKAAGMGAAFGALAPVALKDIPSVFAAAVSE